MAMSGGLSRNARIGIGIAAGLVILIILGTVVDRSKDDDRPRSSEASSTPSSTIRPTPAPQPLNVACHTAPSAIVDIITASFTNGEQLANAQSIDAPRAMTLVGGDIVGADGSRISSRDAWLVSGGAVYAITSDARRHTLLPDGRDVFEDWQEYNAELSNCVGRVDSQSPG